MAELKVYYDRTGHTLTVWFDDPSKEDFASEIGDDRVVMKSAGGTPLGFEKLTVDLEDPENLSFSYKSFAPEIVTA